MNWPDALLSRSGPRALLRGASLARAPVPLTLRRRARSHADVAAGGAHGALCVDNGALRLLDLPVRGRLEHGVSLLRIALGEP